MGKRAGDTNSDAGRTGKAAVLGAPIGAGATVQAATVEARPGGEGGRTFAGGGALPSSPSVEGICAAQGGCLYMEVALSLHCGVAVESFAAIRKKTARGPDWDLVRGQVAYSKNGAELVLLELGIAEKTVGGEIVAVSGDDLEELLLRCVVPAADIVPRGHVAPASEEVQVEVVRFLLNPRMMLCRRLDRPREPLVTVWVTNRKNFGVGMKLPIVPSKNVANQWELNRPLPRFFKRW